MTKKIPQLNEQELNIISGSSKSSSFDGPPICKVLPFTLRKVPIITNKTTTNTNSSNHTTSPSNTINNTGNNNKNVVVNGDNSGGVRM